VHSTLSHDGRLTLPQVAQFYRKRGYHFVAMGEHSQDMNPDKVAMLVEQCGAWSGPDFLMVPGIEYTCRPHGMHILGVGSLGLTDGCDPVSAANLIHEHDGFAVLAHPRRFNWDCGLGILEAVDAVEIWNVGYDGKYLPSVLASAAFRKMQHANPKLRAIASHDLHALPGFYDVATEMEVPVLSRQVILQNLRDGTYRIRSKFFRTDPKFQMSRTRTALLRALGGPLANLRHVRDIALRWSA
jgi:hypothetical protein